MSKRSYEKEQSRKRQKTYEKKRNTIQNIKIGTGVASGVLLGLKIYHEVTRRR